MRRILWGGLIDLILLHLFWFSGDLRIVLLQGLACGNVLYYLFLSVTFLRKTAKKEERHGFLLEFTLLQFFIFMGIFLFKLSDMMILHNAA